VPASSAPIERVFSRGGIIMRPHRSSMSDKLLSTIVFLHCNIVNLILVFIDKNNSIWSLTLFGDFMYVLYKK